ncbi:hypothetical protein CpipJ_CPIJ003065, partial [Culex quinquefasciatus]
AIEDTFFWGGSVPYIECVVRNGVVEIKSPN